MTVSMYEVARNHNERDSLPAEDSYGKYSSKRPQSPFTPTPRAGAGDSSGKEGGMKPVGKLGGNTKDEVKSAGKSKYYARSLCCMGCLQACVAGILAGCAEACCACG